MVKKIQAKKMKFYSEIIALAGRFFGLSSDATESEVHQALVDAKPYESMKAEAIAEAGATLDKINEISAKLESMTTEMEVMKTENSEKAEKVQALDSKVTELETALAEKDAVITSQKQEIESLSASLATYKVKAAPADGPKASIPTDCGLPVDQAKKQTNKHVVTNEQFLSMFNN